MSLKLSVIVPALNEEALVGRCLEAIRAEFTGELLVVDGGSRDRTVEIATPLSSRVLSRPPGLARQLNEAIAAAGGDVLFFVAADCVVPPGWRGAIERALASPYVVGGGFRLRLDPSTFPLRLIAWGGNVRSRYLNIALADQGLFARRASLLAVGGFDESSLIPHARLCLQLQRVGELRLLPECMGASARQWHERGMVSTTARHVRTYLGFRRQERARQNSG